MQKLEVLQSGHFVTGCGDHADAYIHKEKIFLHTGATLNFCWHIANHYENSGVEVVVGLERWGPVLSHCVAFHFSLMDQRVLAGCAQKEGKLSSAPNSPIYRDKFVLKEPTKSAVAGKRVLVVEDVVTTGYNVNQVVKTVRAAGGDVVGVGALFMRGRDIYHSANFFAVVTKILPTWTEKECTETGPCSKGIPINTEIGHGAEFLARQKK